jgi:hypothetical protein
MLLVSQRIHQHIVVNVRESSIHAPENRSDFLKVAIGVSLNQQVGVEVNLVLDVLLTLEVLSSSSRGGVSQVNSAVFAVELRHFG